MYYNSYIKRIKSSIRSEDIDETIKELELLLQYTNKRIVHKIRFDKFCNYPTKLSIGNNILQAFSFELNKHGLDIVYDYSNDGFIDKELSVYLEDVGEYTSEDSEHYYCDGCETHNEHGSSPENSDNYYCIDCFNENTSTCEQCNYSYHHEDSEVRYYEVADRDYCESCADDIIGYCDNCESNTIRDNGCENEDCYYESDDQEEDNRFIKNYGYKPEQLFLKCQNETTNLFYGLEIETLIRKGFERQEIAEKTLNLFSVNHVVLKEDASISGSGFEIVSNTATFEYHKTKLWDNFFGSDIRDNLRSFHDKSTGLHIHASRNFYNKSDIGKIVVFLNIPYNKKFITHLSGREYNSYCQNNPDKKITDYNKDHNRTDALNLTNRNTIEFRIFKGNLAENSVFRYLEFVDCLSHFVKEITLQTNNLKFWHFVKYVYEKPGNKKRYNNLYTWLKVNGYFDILNSKIYFIKNHNVRKSHHPHFRKLKT
tara:strand:- start:1952 stop:3400 length:1449 start_codon:yes stop_codon:yes gene_type:complete